MLLAALFLVTGLGKIGAYAATAGYMESVGVPGALLPVVIAFEVLGAIAIIVGWKTRSRRFCSRALRCWPRSSSTTTSPTRCRFVMFLKNVSIAGGLLLLVANGAGRLSLDGRAEK